MSTLTPLAFRHHSVTAKLVDGTRVKPGVVAQRCNIAALVMVGQGHPQQSTPVSWIPLHPSEWALAFPCTDSERGLLHVKTTSQTSEATPDACVRYAR